ncbi:MAG: TIGR03364 family FAD-dependent oxidoreductase [Bacteroidota bacterium]|nr:TIGR03364 family FAD-dependent oxidoreductase [Bacteroidota bacterium]
MIRKADVAVVGGGIVGLAHAWQAAVRGGSVVLFERDARACGASVRNFGMILPLGAAPGATHAMAMHSLGLWKQLALATGIWHARSGALMVAYHPDEESAMLELAASDTGRDYGCTWLTRACAAAKSPAANADGLLGGLWTPNVMVVDPREVMTRLPVWLAEQYGVHLRYGMSVRSIATPAVETELETWHAQRVIVCPGADLDALYPDILANSNLTYCKLQMMRTVAQPPDWHFGPVLLGGLSIRHYPVFRRCSTATAVARRIARDCPELDRWGIHIMVAQNGRRELIVGDSHEYASKPRWRDYRIIDELLLEQFRGIVNPPSLTIDSRWRGVYVKHPSRDWLVLSPEPSVRVVTGLGGLGMTLSLALAADVFASW